MGKNLKASLDLGSSEIKFLVAQKKEDGWELFYKLEVESKGIKKGEVVDPKRVASAIKEIEERFSRETGQKLPPLFVSLGGDKIFSFLSRGLISVSRADQEISREDLERVLKAAQTVNLGQNREILDVLPQNFIIDGTERVRDPVGLKGMRLEVEALLLVGAKRAFDNLKRAILLSEVEVLDFIPSPTALSFSVLREREKEIGVCLLNLGAQTTEISVFEDGKLIYFSVLPTGTISVTNKIAIFLKTDFEIAERIKREYGSCFCSKRKREKVETEQEILTFTLSSLSRLIREEYSKMFERVRKELKKIGKEKDLPAGIVLTGGGAKIGKIVQLAKQKFKLNARIGKPVGISGIDDLSFSVAVGLILAGGKEEKKEPKILSKIVNFFKNFLP